MVWTLGPSKTNFHTISPISYPAFGVALVSFLIVPSFRPEKADEDTLRPILKRTWSLNLCVQGLRPPLPSPFPLSRRQQQLAATERHLTSRYSLCEIRGDWKWIVELFGLFGHYWKSGRICHRCPASRIPRYFWHWSSSFLITHKKNTLIYTPWYFQILWLTIEKQYIQIWDRFFVGFGLQLEPLGDFEVWALIHWLWCCLATSHYAGVSTGLSACWTEPFDRYRWIWYRNADPPMQWNVFFLTCDQQS